MSTESPISYTFKIPDGPPAFNYETYSFGICPYKVNAKGRIVKAGAAIVRIVIHDNIKESQVWAGEAAAHITGRLNAGHRYIGPKTLQVTREIQVDSLFAV